MRISDWSSDVCSSDLTKSGGARRSICCLASQPTRLASTAESAAGSTADKRRFPASRGGSQSSICAISAWSLNSSRPANTARTRSDRAPSDQGRRFNPPRTEEHTTELQSLMRITYAVFCLKQKTLHHYLQH